MNLISCYRIRFKLPQENVLKILDLIEDQTQPDSVAIGELAEGKQPTKGIEAVELLYENMPDETQLLAIFASENVTPIDYHYDSLAHQDWVTASLRDLPAVTAGRFLIHGTHCKPAVKTKYFELDIDAGLAFGTGHHETTEGCLVALSYLSKFVKPRKIVDIGTGTGVLAMAAVKLWKQSVIATDIDSIAVRVAKNNIRKNNLHPKIRTQTASGASSPLIQNNKKYNLLIANILARPLMALAKDFSGITHKGGYIVLSGLLWRQVRTVYYAYRLQGLVLHKALKFGEWGTLILHKG